MVQWFAPVLLLATLLVTSESVSKKRNQYEINIRHGPFEIHQRHVNAKAFKRTSPDDDGAMDQLGYQKEASLSEEMFEPKKKKKEPPKEPPRKEPKSTKSRGFRNGEQNQGSKGSNRGSKKARHSLPSSSYSYTTSHQPKMISTTTNASLRPQAFQKFGQRHKKHGSTRRPHRTTTEKSKEAFLRELEYVQGLENAFQDVEARFRMKKNGTKPEDSPFKNHNMDDNFFLKTTTDPSEETTFIIVNTVSPAVLYNNPQLRIPFQKEKTGPVQFTPAPKETPLTTPKSTTTTTTTASSTTTTTQKAIRVKFKPKAKPIEEERDEVYLLVKYERPRKGGKPKANVLEVISSQNESRERSRSFDMAGITPSSAELEETLQNINLNRADITTAGYSVSENLASDEQQSQQQPTPLSTIETTEQNLIPNTGNGKIKPNQSGVNPGLPFQQDRLAQKYLLLQNASSRLTNSSAVNVQSSQQNAQNLPNTNLQQLSIDGGVQNLPSSPNIQNSQNVQLQQNAQGQQNAQNQLNFLNQNQNLQNLQNQQPILNNQYENQLNYQNQQVFRGQNQQGWQNQQLSQNYLNPTPNQFNYQNQMNFQNIPTAPNMNQIQMNYFRHPNMQNLNQNIPSGLSWQNVQSLGDRNLPFTQYQQSLQNQMMSQPNFSSQQSFDNQQFFQPQQNVQSNLNKVIFPNTNMNVRDIESKNEFFKNLQQQNLIMQQKRKEKFYNDATKPLQLELKKQNQVDLQTSTEQEDTVPTPQSFRSRNIDIQKESPKQITTTSSPVVEQNESVEFLPTPQSYQSHKQDFKDQNKPKNEPKPKTQRKPKYQYQPQPEPEPQTTPEPKPQSQPQPEPEPQNLPNTFKIPSHLWKYPANQGVQQTLQKPGLMVQHSAIRIQHPNDSQEQQQPADYGQSEENSQQKSSEQPENDDRRFQLDHGTKSSIEEPSGNSLQQDGQSNDDDGGYSGPGLRDSYGRYVSEDYQDYDEANGARRPDTGSYEEPASSIEGLMETTDPLELTRALVNRNGGLTVEQFNKLFRDYYSQDLTESDIDNLEKEQNGDERGRSTASDEGQSGRGDSQEQPEYPSNDLGNPDENDDPESGIAVQINKSGGRHEPIVKIGYGSSKSHQGVYKSPKFFEKLKESSSIEEDQEEQWEPPGQLQDADPGGMIDNPVFAFARAEPSQQQLGRDIVDDQQRRRQETSVSEEPSNSGHQRGLSYIKFEQFN